MLASRHGLYDTIVVSRLHNFIEVRTLLDSNEGLAGGARLVYDAEALEASRTEAPPALSDSPRPRLRPVDTLEEEVAYLSWV